MKRTLLSFTLFFILGICHTSSVFAGEPKATAQLTLEAGRASPQGKLKDYLKPGNVYHLNIFGGAKVDLKFVGAVGLGWDFTFSEHRLKDDVVGHYRRFAWDWFHVPVGLGFLFFRPGLSFVLTNVKIPELEVDESSIRPEIILDAGVRVGVGANVAITGGGRAEWAWRDSEKTSLGHDLEITGNFMSWLAGLSIYF